jgi:hypothetical protein
MARGDKVCIAGGEAQDRNTTLTSNLRFVYR